MKIQAIKQEVFSLTSTCTTQELKKQHPKLIGGRDLRYKAHWFEILEQVQALHAQSVDLSLTELEESEKMLQQSLITVGLIAGLSHEEISLDWQRIKLEAQISDIHIKEL